MTIEELIEHNKKLDRLQLEIVEDLLFKDGGKINFNDPDGDVDKVARVWQKK